MSQSPFRVNEGAQKAREYRTRVGLDCLGPVPDLLSVVEGLGGLAVSVVDLPDGVSGAYTFEEGQGFVFVNLRDAVVRQRFTLAHELAHHIFDDGAVVDDEEAVFGSSSRPVERRARTFAAEFLVPLRAVDSWFTARGANAVTLQVVVELATYFRVSAKTALIRLSLARLIEPDGDAYKRLEGSVDRGEHKQLEKRLGIEETPDALSEIEAHHQARPPRKLWEYAVAGYEQGLLTVPRIAQATFTTPERVQKLFDDAGILQTESEPDF